MGKANFLKLIFFLLCFAYFISAVSAHDVLDQSVSTNAVLHKQMDFFSAIKYSLENNNNLRALCRGLSATERDIGIARSDMLPHFRFNENFLATNSPVDALGIKLNQARVDHPDLALATLNYPGANINFLTSGFLEQRILDVKDIMEIKIAKKNYSANAYMFLRKQEELTNEVAQAYLKVMEAQELIDTTEKSISEEKEYVSIAKQRLEKKTGFPSDPLRAQTIVDEDEEKLVSLKRSLNVSRRNLGLLLGLEEEIYTTNSVPEIKLQPQDYYKAVSVYRNDIKALELKVESAKKGIKAAQSEWLPTLNAFASYNFYDQHYPFGGQGNNYVTGANFRWDILDGNKRRYDILKAKDKEAEAEEYLIWLRKNVDFKVYESYLKVEEYKDKYEISVLVLQHSEDDTKKVKKRWTNSQLPFVSLIDAQINLESARLDAIKYKYDLKKAIINLTYESGIISQELGLG